MSQQPKYFFSPTLLDCYNDYICSESNWNKYYVDRDVDDENYIALSQYEEEQYNKLIDRINRVKSEPIEAAEKGTAWNDLVDTLLHNKPCGHTKFAKLYYDNENKVITTDEVGNPIGVRCMTGNFTFDFDLNFAMTAALYFGKKMVTAEGMVINENPSDKCDSQVLVEANIETRYGVVNLYGFIDEMRRDIVYDIKTTSRYEFGKYEHYNQRFVYPYCLIESGYMNCVTFFEFTAYVLTGGNSRTPLITGKQYSEVYNYDHESAKNYLRNTCERFIEFIEANRDKITDTNIFTKHSHNH